MHALCFHTVKGAAYLARQIAKRQPQIAGFRQQVELDFLLAGAKRIGNVEDAVVARQLCAQFGCGHA